MLAGGFLAPVLLMVSLAATPAATASLLLNTEAVWTALLAAAFFAEGIGRRVWGGIGAITAAGMILSFDPAGHLGLSLGALGVVGACALWGLDNNCARQISSKDPLAIGTVKGLGAGLLSLALALALGERLPPLDAALAAALLGAVCYGVSMVCFLLALRSLGAARTAGVFGLAPFIGAGLALAISPVPPGPQFLVALPLMAAGALLIAREEHAHVHLHEETTHAHRHRHDLHHLHAHDDGAEAEVHAHVHTHAPLEHAHAHTPDIHHRHRH
jgi:drug/metabolite transporter (DMT)-like permease